jgi:predicted permease
MSVWLKLRTLIRRRDVELELDEEIRYHIERQTEHNISLGMSNDEARQAAIKALAGVDQVKEACRDKRGFNFPDNLIKDLRYALRGLFRSPGFTIAAILTIALGIGINAGLFSFFNAVALRPLPVAHPAEVFRLKRWFQDGYRGDQQYRFSYEEYAHIRDGNGTFKGLVAVSIVSPVINGDDTFQVQAVSANFFDVVGIRPYLGRTFPIIPTADRGLNESIVLSHSFWKGHFNSDSQIVGKTLKANDAIYTIAGVAPESFTGTTFVVPDFWIPLLPNTTGNLDWLNGSSDYKLELLGRLKPSLSMGRAQAEADTLLRQYPRTRPEPVKTMSLTLEHTAAFGNVDDIGFRIAATAVRFIVSLVLLVACANLANMMLARGTARQREIGIRLALGGSRWRIIRQLVIESLLLSIAGAALGVVLSFWTLQLLWDRIVGRLAPQFLGSLTVKLNFAPDVRVFAYAFGLAITTVLLFGLLPALQTTRLDLGRSLKDEAGFFRLTARRSLLRSVFIGTQVTISMLFLLLAGLLMRGLLRSQNSAVGFDTRTLYLLTTDFGNGPESLTRRHHLIDRLKALPEVSGVASGYAPFFGTWTPPITVDGKTDSTLASTASENYFEVLDIPILRGRRFTEQEAQGGAHVAVISESTARRFWPGQDPLSKTFKLDPHFRGTPVEYEIVGISRDVRFANPTRIDPSHVYLPLTNTQAGGLLFRIQGNREAALIAVRKAAEATDPKLMPYLQLKSIEQGPLAALRVMAQALAYFLSTLAALALSLAGVGIYGVMAYVVAQRIKEIGIRMALGARSPAILLDIMIAGISPVLIGMAIGFAAALTAAWLFHRTLSFPGSSDFLQGVPFYDPIVFAGLTCFFLVVAASSSLVPARRALQLDPLVVLRHE